MSRPTRRAFLRGGPRFVVLSFALLGTGALAWWIGVVRPARAHTEAEARAAIVLARDSLQTGQPARALLTLARVPKSGPWAAEVLTIQGMAFASLERPEDARPLLERSLAIDPKQAMAAKVLAAVYFSDNEMDRGLTMLARAASIDPSDFRPWFAAGDVLLRYRNQPREASEVFRQAIARRPEDEASRVGLASALFALGETEEAVPLVDSLLREFPDDPTVLRLAATRARFQSKPDEVERYASLVLSHDPDDVEMLLIRAQSRLESGHQQEALGDAERAVARSPENLTALHLLTRIESAAGLKERAAATALRHRSALAIAGEIERLQNEVRKRPNDLEPRWRLGEAAARGGKLALARQCFQAALALDPNCQPARAGLAALGPPANRP
jgi:tetratricopeptide (TPR) repeat protein